MLYNRFTVLVTTLLALLISSTHAKRTLSATSLVTCMDRSQITPNLFNVTFNPDDRSLQYSLDLTTEISAKVTAHVQVYAYGFLIIEKDVDMCSIGWKQFCPIYPGVLKVDSVEYISSKYTSMIPGIAYQVPDIDAVVKVLVKDEETGELLSCIQSGFSNGKTVSQTGVKWASAVIAGLGLLIAAMLSTFGNSNAASHISANSVSLFLYFQSVVVVSMQAVDRVPPIASAWSENLAWSMGLIKIKFMQDIFRWYVQSTGGNPTTYLKGVVQQIVVQKRKRSLEYVEGLAKRALDYGLRSNRQLIILRGIERIGFNSNIEPTSIVATGFTWTVLIGYLLVALLVIVKLAVMALTRAQKMSPGNFTVFRGSFHNVVKGSLSRYLYLASTQLVLFSLWEFTRVDSAALVVLAALFIVLLLAIVGWSYFNVMKVGKQSVKEYNNPAARLYGDNKVLDKYGFCYTMFHADKYWFGPVLIGYNVFKVIFIAFCQTGVAGKVSCLPVFIADLAYTIFLIWQAPYLNKPTNIINYTMSIVVTINSFLFLFFSDLFNQKAPVASIMGWIFFILNAAFSLILLIMIVLLILFSVLSKNPDARFAPAKDDRFSFKRKSSVLSKRQSTLYFGKREAEAEGDGELAALGVAAQDHSQDWESQMYKLGEVSQNNSSIYSLPEHLAPNHDANRNSDAILETTSASSSSPLEDANANQHQVQNQLQRSGSLGARIKDAVTRPFARRPSTQKKTAERAIHEKPRRDVTVNLDYSDDENSEKDSPAPISHTFVRQDRNTAQNIHTRNQSSSTSELNTRNPTSTKDFV
ncbi:uncharacterized protein LODBEIA_P22790 [Lodderomyces beijingensis]|uniref:ML-like domain-containing protein n=1 Tax=Lodderomyces beijingensis TaxID=1775926 RepID=A0ABP0ZPA5_9ASCO